MKLKTLVALFIIAFPLLSSANGIIKNNITLDLKGYPKGVLGDVIFSFTKSGSSDWFSLQNEEQRILPGPHTIQRLAYYSGTDVQKKVSLKASAGCFVPVSDDQTLVIEGKIDIDGNIIIPVHCTKQ